MKVGFDVWTHEVNDRSWVQSENVNFVDVKNGKTHEIPKK